MLFTENSISKFKAHYPGAPVLLRHSLNDHPLFEIERLTKLAAVLPPHCVEYNAGDLPVSQDPAMTPMNGLSAEETVRRIAENNSWMVLKQIEQDGDYADLLNSCLGDIEPAARTATGQMHQREGFIFVSSPGAVTPFHMDPEHNILLQLRGRKAFRIYPNDAEEIVSHEQHEAFYKPGGHRNLSHKDEFERHARLVELGPGDALYVPVKSPHWVKNADEVSVSLSITWRSRASDNEARLRRANGWIRRRGGRPPAPGAAPIRDRCVIFGRHMAERLGRE
ncbi:cupin-like domain-containing protein [Hyphococcus sp.]|uniref:cupin-like domain-containing protein n=1 Tax=Hyphococcus sp. TaxID=2038636 RepID=UPI003CCC0D34